MSVALIVAAGSGERLGAGRPKALVELAGRPMLAWSLDVLATLQEIASIVVALPAGAQLPSALADSGSCAGRVLTVVGGATRSESVKRALAAAQHEVALGAGLDFVLVHDAARPLLTAELAQGVIDALAARPDADGAIAAAPVTDTVKRVDAMDEVHETLDRGALWAVQTPQVFRRGALQRALEVPALELARATDDAWLIERAGGKVILAPTTAANLKVTTPLDLRIAELLLGERTAASDTA